MSARHEGEGQHVAPGTVTETGTDAADTPADTAPAAETAPAASSTPGGARPPRPPAPPSCSGSPAATCW